MGTKLYKKPIFKKKKKKISSFKNTLAFGFNNFQNEDNEEEEPTRAAQSTTTRNHCPPTCLASSAINSYDDQYESFSTGYQQQQKSSTSDISEKSECKYIKNLVDSAKRRKYEQEIIKERKVAKELLDDQDKYLDKDSFITSGYKKRIEEREKWKKTLLEADEKIIDRKNNNVRKGFYGNLHVILGMNNHLKTGCNSHNSLSVLEEEPEPQNDVHILEGVKIEKRDANNTPIVYADHMHNNYHLVRENESDNMKFHRERNIENQKKSKELQEKIHQVKFIDKVLATRERYLVRKKDRE